MIPAARSIGSSWVPAVAQQLHGCVTGLTQGLQQLVSTTAALQEAATPRQHPRKHHRRLAQPTPVSSIHKAIAVHTQQASQQRCFLTREDVARFLQCSRQAIRIKYSSRTYTPQTFYAVFDTQEACDKAFSRALGAGANTRIGGVPVEVLLASDEEVKLVADQEVVRLVQQAAQALPDANLPTDSASLAVVTCTQGSAKDQILDAFSSYELVPPYVVERRPQNQSVDGDKCQRFVVFFASPADAVRAACDSQLSENSGIGKLKVQPLA